MWDSLQSSVFSAWKCNKVGILFHLSFKAKIWIVSLSNVLIQTHNYKKKKVLFVGR